MENNHPVIDFYLERIKSSQNFSLHSMWEMPHAVIGDGYFYIEWLLPVSDSSKWNLSVPVFCEFDAKVFRSSAEIQQKYLKSIDIIMAYFELTRENEYFKPTPILENRKYWLREVGHESKKISRIIRSLDLCGHPRLARNLRQIALQLGKEKGYVTEETTDIWLGLLED